MKYTLNEALFEDAFEDVQVSILEDDADVVVSDVDQEMVDGVANLISNEIVGELETLNSYRNTRDAVEIVAPEAVPVLDDIMEEENEHIGQLQVALDLVAPESEKIEDGIEEGEEQIATGDAELELGYTDAVPTDVYTVDFDADDDIEGLF